MVISDQQVKALHLEGGNYFDDMRIDIAESHRRFANLKRNTKRIKRSKWRNMVNLYSTALCIRFGIQEFLVTSGIKRRWFYNFRTYWSQILNGRPFWNTLDFFMILHDYRKRQQYTSQLEWGAPEQHLANWQHPGQIYSTLFNVARLAIHPIMNWNLFKKMPKGVRVLEYGCSLAPYYHCYRKYFSHLDCRWALADIPSYPFHYAKYLYRNDSEVEFVIINAEDFSNPLGEDVEYDVIILTTVLEHLDNPLYISEYLLNRLSPGGLFVFDYIKSEGMGLDHPEALEMRNNCIKQLLETTEIIEGQIDDITESIDLCITRKKTS